AASRVSNRAAPLVRMSWARRWASGSAASAALGHNQARESNNNQARESNRERAMSGLLRGGSGMTHGLVLHRLPPVSANLCFSRLRVSWSRDPSRSVQIQEVTAGLSIHHAPRIAQEASLASGDQ